MTLTREEFVMRGDSFREADLHVVEGTAPRDAGTADRTGIATPATLWLGTAESMFRWYGAMVRLAFGLEPMNGRNEAQRMIAPPAPVKPIEAPVKPIEGTSPDLASHSRPALTKLRPKRKKTSPRGKKRGRNGRSAKVSSITRGRRAA
jgi:hypothetical protein